MGHGTFIFEGEITPLYEWSGGEAVGGVCDYITRGWPEDAELLGMFAGEDSLGLVPELSAVERCYAHVGWDGTVFYHAEPGPGQFRVTHVWRESVRKEIGGGER